MTATAEKIDFNNIQEAFQNKSTKELKQAEWLFRMLNHKTLGPIGKAALKFAVAIGLPVKPFIKATLYKHFVGGESLEDCLPLVDKLEKQHVNSILDYSEEAKETEEEIEKAFQELMRNVKFAGEHPAISFSVFKATAIASSDLLEKVSNGDTLSEKEAENWKKVEQRFDMLCNTAFFHKVPIMIDAEETWIQPAIDDLTTHMMQKYNKEKVTVLNTFQMYRKDRLSYLHECYKLAQEQGYKLGVKLVRGAYQEKERARAESKGYASPIQDTKEDTDNAYNEALRFCMERLDEIMLVVATHNEESCMLATDLLLQTSYKKNYHYLWFSQLLGMCDHVSFTLANKGYNVAKYVPYGPVKAVTPYLIRRADENSSVAGQAQKEMRLLSEEIRRREKGR